MPIPDVASANDDCCAISAPDKATKPFDRLMPRIVVLSVFAPKLRIMRLLSPVARSDKPRSVLRNASSANLKISTSTIMNGIGGNAPSTVSSPMMETFGIPRIRRLIE